MNYHGIKFTNRAKRDGRDPTYNYSEFIAFAALCAANGVDEHVKSVNYDDNICSFEIDVDDKHEMNDIGGAIEWCADKTLDQFIIFGRCYHKRGLDNIA